MRFSDFNDHSRFSRHGRANDTKIRCKVFSWGFIFWIVRISFPCIGTFLYVFPKRTHNFIESYIFSFENDLENVPIAWWDTISFRFQEEKRKDSMRVAPLLVTQLTRLLCFCKIESTFLRSLSSISSSNSWFKKVHNAEAIGAATISFLIVGTNVRHLSCLQFD